MSVFSQLMMRKKEQIMYATIKGNLTESPSGVFSNWSLSNYLEIQDLVTFGTKNFELKVCITPSSTNLSRIFCSDESNFTGIYVRSGNFAGSYYDGTTRNIIETTVPYSANTTYYAILYRSGTKIGIKVSTDDVNYTDFSQTISSSTEVVIGAKFIFGINKFGSTYINGSIDLNNSYIKLGSTKYNLQAVAGYTVVGSPTITDGVVSGFTTSDYIRINTFNNIGTQDFELATAFVTNTSINMRIIATYGAGGTFTGVSITNLGGIRFVVYNGTNQYIVTSSQIYQTETKYYIKSYRKGTEVGIKVSTDNVNWITNTTVIPENTNLVNSSEFLDFGVNRYGAGALNGSIDLNNTYIKINNKLWFNGQQA